MDPKGEAAMTKDQIERYGGICDKIVALRSLKVRDTVQGSSSEIPYQKHTIVLEGGIAEGKNSRPSSGRKRPSRRRWRLSRMKRTRR